MRVAADEGKPAMNETRAPHGGHDADDAAGRHDAGESAEHHVAHAAGAADHDGSGALGPLDRRAWAASALGVAIGLATAAVFWLAVRGG